MESPPLQWQCSFFDQLCCINDYSNKKKKKNNNKNCKHINRCPRWESTARIFCDVIYVGDFRLVEFALHVLHSKYPNNERNKTRLTLAPNRGSLGMLWTYSGSVVVLSWDLTHTHTHTHTHTQKKNTRRQAHAHTNVSSHWPSLARHKHARSAPSAYETHAFAQRHKTDRNRPVNLACKLQLLPCHFCINFKMFSLNQQGDLLSAPPCHMTD